MSQSCDEEPDVYRIFQRRARKMHTCSACHGEIRKGDAYTREDVLFEREWTRTLRCGRCQIIFDHLMMMCRVHGESDEYPDPELDCGHDYRERWEVDPPEWLAGLAFWLPGDPLPSTVACTSLLGMLRVPVHQQRNVCTAQVWRHGRRVTDG